MEEERRSYSKLSRAECYAVLELQPNADQESIKAAYRRLCMKHHPDKAHGDPRANQRFAQIREAWEVLTGKLGAAEDNRRQHRPNQYDDDDNAPHYAQGGQYHGQGPRPSQPPRGRANHTPSLLWYPRALGILAERLRSMSDSMVVIGMERLEIMEHLGRFVRSQSPDRVAAHMANLRRYITDIEADLVTARAYVELARQDAGMERSRIRSLMDEAYECEMVIERLKGHLTVVGLITSRAERLDPFDDELVVLRQDLWLEMNDFKFL